MNFQINLSCSNHPQKKVEFFTYNISSNKYELVCSRCISKLPKDTITVDTEEIFSQNHKYITNWPPLKNEQLQEQIQKKLENQDEQETETGGNNDSQKMFAQMRDQFQAFLINFEANLKNLPQGSQVFSQKYQEISQSKTLLSFIKQEVSKKEKFTDVCQDFKTFLKQRCQENQTDQQLESALDDFDENPQEQQLTKLQQTLKIFYNNYKDLPQKLQKIQDISEVKKNQKTERQKKVEMSSMFEDTTTKVQQYISMNHFYQKCLGKMQRFRDHFKHQLEFTLGQNVFCSKCSPNKTLSYYWACQQCKYYLCLDCTQSSDQFNKFYDKLLDSRLQKSTSQNKDYYGYVFLFAVPDRDRDRYCNSCTRKIAGEQKYTWLIKDQKQFLCIVCTQHFSDIIVEKKYFSSPDIPIDFFNPNYFQILQQNQQYVVEVFINPSNQTLKKANQLPYIEFVVQAQQNLNQQDISNICQAKIDVSQQKQIVQIQNNNNSNQSNDNTNCLNNATDHDSNNLNKSNTNEKSDIQNSQVQQANQMQSDQQENQEKEYIIIKFSEFFKKNLNISKKFPKIDFRHDLTFMEKDGKQCKICSKSINNYCWSCESCDYYICINCITIEPFDQYYQKLINTQCDEKIGTHLHSKMQFKRFSQMRCDSCRKDSQNLYGWECSDPVNKCNFTICIDCSSKFGDAMADTKVYKSLPEIPIQTSQNMNSINSKIQQKYQQQTQQDDEDFLIVNFQEFFKKNLNAQKKFPKIDFKHDLTFIEKVGKYCKICSRSINSYCWFCDSCNYYICIECISTEPFNLYYQRLINSECDEKIEPHRHSKMQFKKFTKMTCDSCRKDSKNLFGWECSDPVNKCNFTLCINCSSKFGEIMVDTKIYKSQPEQQISHFDDECMTINFQDFFKKNLNVQKQFPIIDFKHGLKFVQKDGKYCKICSRSLKNYCWSCNSCNYYICIECVTTDPFDQYYQKLINTECDEQVGTHLHSKMKFKKFAKMICDSCRKDSKNLFGWECSDPVNKCNFTLCIDCSSQFGDVMVDKQVYKSIPEISIQNNQNVNGISSSIQQENDFIIINFQEFFKKNLNIQKKFPKIDFKHDLKFVEKNGKQCKMCSRQLNNYCWSCDLCDYQICIECISIEPFNQYYQKLINSECDETIGSHKHSKMIFKEFTKMRCDLCRKDSKNLYGWECCDPTNKCSFTLCIDCSSQFGDVMVDIKIYQSIPEIPIEINQNINNKLEQDNDFIIINFQEFFKKNLNIQKKFPKIDFKHDLKFVEKNGKQCKMCSRQLNNYCWSCDLCDYQICIECISIEPFNQYYQKLINSECDETIGSHKHSKMIFKEFTKMRCDLCRKDSKSLYGWECCDPTNKCNFTLCIDCSSKFGDVMVDIKIYQSLPEIPIEINQNINSKLEQDNDFIIINFQEFFKKNLNIQKKFPQIDFKHYLKFAEINGKYCKTCSRMLSNYCWSCDSCNYYICIECISTEPFNQYYQRLINSECDEKVGSHRHSKMIFTKFTKMKCDSCRKDSKNLFGWECSDPVNKCNFTLCINCSSQFGDVMVDSKVYQSLPEIPAQSNQNINSNNIVMEQDNDFMIVNFADFFKKNLNIQKKFPKIDFKHDLKFVEKNGKQCKMCSRQLNNYCWSCDLCDYQICIECISIEPFNQYYQKLINSVCDENVGSHKHSKMIFKEFTKMRCDLCRKDSKNLYGWECCDPTNKCSFTLCIDCSSKFGGVMVDTKVYQSLPEIPAQSNQNINSNNIVMEQDNDFMIVNFADFFKKNLNIQKKFPKIDFKHDLKFVEKNGKQCKMCSRQLNNYCWSCDLCDYQICIECISIEPFNQYYQKLVNSECDEKIGSHRHSKMHFKKFTKMSCEKCRKDSKNLYGWECSDPVNKCRFTLCIDCSSKFGDVMVDTKVYQSLPEIPDQSNLNINNNNIVMEQDNNFMIVNFADFFKKNLNIQRKFPKIDFKHDLRFVEKNGKYCKLCSRQVNQYCWSCDLCDYYICIECISPEPFNQYYQKLINSECDEKIGSHRHTKMQFKKFIKMSCDSCRKDSKNLFGWECYDPVNKCKFTLCIDCSSKFGDVMVDIKIYQSLPEIPIQLNQSINNMVEQDNDFMIVNFSEFFKKNLNIQKKFPQIDFKHYLKFAENKGKYCKICSRMCSNYCWSCESCDKYVCIECISIEPFNQYYQKLINSECDEKVGSHRHSKMQFKKFTKMSCDSCRKDSKNLFGWECSDPANKCNFTVCIDCSSKFGEIMVDTLVYKSIPDITPQFEDNEQDDFLLLNFQLLFKNLANLKHRYYGLHYVHDLYLLEDKKQRCNLCWQSIQNVCWNCQECELFICLDCIPSSKMFSSIYSKLLNSEAEENLQNLRHKKFKFSENINKQNCDNCKQKRKGDYGWICTQQGCGEFVCLNCSSNFKEINVNNSIQKQESTLFKNIFNILKNKQNLTDSIMQEITQFNKDEADENISLCSFEQIFKNNLNLKNKLKSHNYHELQLEISKGGCCQKCVQSTTGQYVWNCQQCNKLFCINCTSLESDLKYYYDKFLNSEYDKKIGKHAHVKFIFRYCEKGGSIRCEICNRPQSNQFYYWSCATCDNRFEICLKCSQTFNDVKIDQKIYQSQPDPPLRQTIQQDQIEEQKEEEEELKLNISQYFLNCINTKYQFDSHSAHMLVFSDIQKGACRKCDRSLKSYCWRCEECNYSLCLDCSSTVQFFQYFYSKIVKAQYDQQVYNHKHSQIAFVSFADGKSGKRCDICQRSLLYYGWKCGQCSFDLCLNCSGKFETVKLDLEVYKSQPSISQNQIKESEVTVIDFKQFFQNCLKVRQKFDSHKDHELVFTDYSKGCCKKCNRSLKSYSWRCEPCDYSLCLDCTSTLKYFQFFYNKLVKCSYQQNLDKHNHGQVNFNCHPDGKSGRACDFCSMSVFYYGWKCPQCSFDICLNCSGQFRQLKLDMQVYNSQPNVPEMLFGRSAYSQFLQEESKSNKKNDALIIKKLEWKASSEYYDDSVPQNQDHCQGNYQQFFQSQIHEKKKFTFKSHKHELHFTSQLDKIVQCNVCQSDVVRYFWKCEQCSYYICLNCSAQVDSFQEFYNSLTKPQFCFIENNGGKENKLVFIKHLVKPKDVCYTCRYPIKLYSWSDLKLCKYACLNCTNSFFSVLPVDPLTYKQKIEQPKQLKLEQYFDQDQ
ncbi:hypothetical protein ABPG72_018631 [Tetrahymena utriculariae]